MRPCVAWCGWSLRAGSATALEMVAQPFQGFVPPGHFSQQKDYLAARSNASGRKDRDKEQ